MKLIENGKKQNIKWEKMKEVKLIDVREAMMPDKRNWRFYRNLKKILLKEFFLKISF